MSLSEPRLCALASPSEPDHATWAPDYSLAGKCPAFGLQSSLIRWATSMCSSSRLSRWSPSELVNVAPRYLTIAKLHAE